MDPQTLFTMLSDETRVRCLVLMVNQKKICVCEFATILESIQPKISRHLALLLKSGVVKNERKGNWVYYYINEELKLWAREVLELLYHHLKDVEPYSSDLKKLLKESVCK